MPPKYFKFTITYNVYGTVYFRTETGTIADFVVKLHYIEKSKDYEIIRYDAAHGGVHRDVLRPDGSKYIMDEMHHLSKKEGLTFAIKDVRTNWKSYVERFQRWHKDQREK